MQIKLFSFQRTPSLRHERDRVETIQYGILTKLRSGLLRYRLQRRPLALMIVIFGLLTSCVSYDLSRQIVQQGNLLPEARVNKLKIGMSKESVAQVLGTSLITPLFDNNHWDYAFTIKHANDPMMIKRVSLDFANNRLVKISEPRP